jgi:glutamate 5-kinase
LQVAGKLVLDAGAIKALRSGKSLLPIGVVSVFGEFERGAVVACVSEDGSDIARGLTNYNASEARRITRHASQEIETLLGYGGDAEIIHRDNLVLL